MDYNLLQYAYIGDAVYELLVRTYLCEINIVKTKDLREKSLLFVSAKRQAYFLECLEKDNFLLEEEREIIRKGRNCKVHSKPKNCDILTYKYATAFEVFIGFLYHNNYINRINEIFDKIKKIVKDESLC